MRVFVTGATGFVGTRVCEDLIRVGYEVRALVRPGSTAKWSRFLRKKVNVVDGDVLNGNDLRRGMKGCGAVIHLVGIIREFRNKGVTFERMHTEATRAAVEAAKAEGVKRFLHMSALGTRPDAPSRYHTTKWAAEEIVRASGLDWTIFRPSLIIGPGKGFATEMAGLIQFGWIPVIGSGSSRMQPVALPDVSRGFVLAVETPDTVGQIYDMGGPQVMTFNQCLDVLGVSRSYERLHKLHMPVSLALFLAKRFDQIPFFPFGVDQVKMVNEDNVGHTSDATWRRFGIQPTPMLEATARFLGTPARLAYDPDAEVARALEEGRKRLEMAAGLGPVQESDPDQWRDSKKPVAARMEIVRRVEKPDFQVFLEAAMAQTDCGACGYDCHGYAEALAKGKEKNTTLCAPGADATQKVVEQLFSEFAKAPGAA